MQADADVLQDRQRMADEWKAFLERRKGAWGGVPGGRCALPAACCATAAPWVADWGCSALRDGGV